MEQVVIMDVTPRDGLQDAEGYVPLEDKVALIQELVEAGVHSVEVTSFVHPTWIPLLADGDRLVPLLRRLKGEWIALAPNERGVERAVASGVSGVTLVASASESHNRANLNHSRTETLAILRRAAERAHSAGLKVRGAVSTAFDCPFEGTVPIASVMTVVEAYLAMGVAEIGIADTIGTANPAVVKERVRTVNDVRGTVPLSLHLHDRYGWALANVSIAYEYGVRHFETALGSLGGCPYAPGAAGNLDTEKLVSFFAAQGIATDIDLAKLATARERLFGVLSQRLSVPE